MFLSYDFIEIYQTITDTLSIMKSDLYKLPQMRDNSTHVDNLRLNGGSYILHGIYIPRELLCIRLTS